MIEAAGGGGGEPLDLELAGIRIRLRFKGPTARDLAVPLAHLAKNGPEPEWTLLVLDGGGDPSGLPRLPFEIPPPGPGGTAYLRFQDEEVAIVSEATNRIVWVFDVERRIAAAMIPDLGALPEAEHDARLRHPLQMILSEAGRPLIHSALVGVGDRGALLPGKSGSGKSTLALACARNGLDFCSDDYIVLVPGELRGHSLLRTAKLTPDSARHLGMELDPRGEPWRYEDRGGLWMKATVDVAAVATKPLRETMGIEMLVVPRIAGVAEPRMNEIPPREALKALAATLVQQPTRDPLLFSSMMSIVRGVPCFELELSPDPVANAAALSRALAPGRSAP